MNIRNAVQWLTLLCFYILIACNSPFTPKPKGYFKINLPEKKYQLFNNPDYPYSFEYPSYATVMKDSSFFGESPENPWWINIDFPTLNGNIYISYKEVNKYKLEKLVNDAFNLTNKHSIKASAINDSLIITSNGIKGMFFKVEGDVATANQFFLTDSVNHFIRGALYFNATPNEDSLRPVNEFLVRDMQHLINTFRWK